jgi:hypothetical protein
VSESQRRSGAGLYLMRPMILLTASLKPPRVSSSQRRRCDRSGAGVLWVRAFTTFPNCLLSVSTKAGTFRSGAGFGSERRGSRCPRLSSFSPASVALSLSLPRGFHLFLALPLLCAFRYGVGVVPDIGLTFPRGYLSVAFLLRRQNRRE